ncbi:unnamed protein product [Adineta ricciae]|uniref:Uncharacterized protein n=1 Tax=Adineta ricciae TaxID=249248 RepID=A0A815AFH2_ADIRI|nr:unnamed protein product [Adineta ricciae]
MILKCQILLNVIILLIITNVSFELKLSPKAAWNQIGTTVAGDRKGSAGSNLSQLNEPVDIYITNNDILYIGDSYNHRILVVHLNSSTNNSAIGSGPGPDFNQLNRPDDVFVFNASLYVLDTSNYRVQKVALDGSNVTTVAHIPRPGTGPGDPLYLYVTNEGNIYVSERLGHCIWLFFPNSTTGHIIAGQTTWAPRTLQIVRTIES